MEYILLLTIIASSLIWLPAASVLFTLLHSAEELVGPGGPIWDNFGKITNVKLPNKLGFIMFTGGLSTSLIILAALGYSGNFIALSILLGARLGDTIISHFTLRLTGVSNPNPGLMTTPLYILESILIISNWNAYLHPAYILIGVAFFAAVLPTMFFIGKIFPQLQREKYV